MSTKSTTISGIVETARLIVEALRKIDPALAIHGKTQGQMVTKLERYGTVNTALASANLEVSALMNERDGLLKYFEELPVETREVIAGIYTKNSNAYEWVGGRRPDEIVRRGGRKPKSSKKSDSNGTANTNGLTAS